MIADLDEGGGNSAADEIKAMTGSQTAFLSTDVTQREQVSAAVSRCREQFGNIKVMVNNAGFNKPEPFLNASEEM